MKVFKQIIQTSLLLLVFSGVPSLEAARNKNSQAGKGAIDAKTFEKLMRAQELTQNDQHAEAIKALDQVKARGDKLNGYAKSQMWNFYAYIYANQEKYDQAISSYKKVIAEPEATEGLVLQAKYTIAQLYFQKGDFKSCIRFMQDWLSGGSKPTATAHIMLAQAYYQTKNFDAALSNVDKAVAIEKAKGISIKENWLRLKAALYYDKGDMKRTAQTYEDLVKYYPKLSYLKQLAGMYGEIGEERKRLAIYDAIYIKGGLQGEKEILNLAYMFLGQDLPYKAGKIIEKGMGQSVIQSNQKNVETLGNAWAQANQHNKAIPALEKAAKMSPKGMLYARLAGVHFDAGDYQKASQAAKNAASKGGLKNKGNNDMLLGMSYFNLKKYEAALQAFRVAKSNKKNFKDAAAWEKHTLAEIKRLAAIEAGKLELEKKTKETLEADENNETI